VSAPDAVVIGSGPNGLVAANLLADAGWDVLVLEAQDVPGGAVQSAEVAAPGYVSDLFSSFYPLALGSPVLRDLRLEDHGLHWRHAPAVLAHPLLDGRTAVLSRDLDVTCASVDAFAAGDGAAWRRLAEQWQEIKAPLVDVLMGPFPPVRAGLDLARALGPRELLRFARFGVLPMRRYAQEEFAGEGAALLVAGNALHTDLTPESTSSALFGWLLAMLGQDVGFPVPEGGAGGLTQALVTRLERRGGRLECGQQVRRVQVRDGTAVAVETADRVVPVCRAVLADVSAIALYRHLLDDVPSRLLRDLDRFDSDDATVKVDWALSGPIPWANEGVAGAGTVHLGGGLDAISDFSHALALNRMPDHPFVLLGQMTTTDPTRSPAGTESAWAYSHVPSGREWSAPARAAWVDRLEAWVEQFAPGFRELVVGRFDRFPDDMQRVNANLLGGAVNGGTSALHQQLFFRPTPSLGRPETFVRGLYLASAGAHPGGGVHGSCGANAARAALRSRTTGRVALALTRALVRDGAPAAPAAEGSRRSGA
jgi:phytoene dehydrogenase-like protein